MSDGPEWFEPENYGIGAGLPIAWQGWAVLAAYVVILTDARFAFGPNSAATAATLVIATALLLVISVRTTRGG